MFKGAEAMEQAARMYLDDSKLFTSHEEPEKEKIPIINHDAVRWYERYFEKMMQHHTFQLRLNNGDLYYVFSTVDEEEWQKRVKNRMSIQATKFLDKITMESITIHSIIKIRDVSVQVRHQYEEQRKMIFNSYSLVEQIMQYKETKFVEEMIHYVTDSRKNDESKRKFWRIVNEKYYGLDIHPLMEYEEEELEKILYYCQNPNEQKILKWRPAIRVGAVSAGAILTGWLTYLYFFN